MILLYIALSVLALSLAAIIFIIIKRIPDLTTINTESIPEERESKVRNRIIVERLARKLANFINVITTFWHPISETLKDFFSDLYKTILDLEKKTQQQVRPLKTVEIKQLISEKLQSAKQHFDKSELVAAENDYIEVVRLDPKNIEAFEGLSQIYLANRDYKKSRETVRYCVKLLGKKITSDTPKEEKHRLASCYADLGNIYQLESKNQLAFANFAKATELEPNNPRFLDLMLKISIMLKNKEAAWRAFNALSETDPGNQKLSDLRQEIEALPDQQEGL